MISNIPVKSLPNQTVRVEVKFDEQKHFYFLKFKNTSKKTNNIVKKTNNQS